MKDVKAVVFDVFGTLVDWRSGVAREAARVLGGQGIAADWGALADAWRAQYQPAMERVRSGDIPFSKLDVLHRLNLDHVLGAMDIPADEATRRELTLAWHRLDAWPDVVPGLQALRVKRLIAPCSNGHIALMVNLARRNGFVWDAILGAELARDYKPKLAVYQHTAAAFDLDPSQVMMVAAHSSDLAAARQAGLKTCFVARPAEHGPGKGETVASVPVDCSVQGIDDLVRLME